MKMGCTLSNRIIYNSMANFHIFCKFNSFLINSILCFKKFSMISGVDLRASYDFPQLWKKGPILGELLRHKVER